MPNKEYKGECIGPANIYPNTIKEGHVTHAATAAEACHEEESAISHWMAATMDRTCVLIFNFCTLSL